MGDRIENMAVKLRVFGEHAYKVAVSSTKSAAGHFYWAAPRSLEAGITVLAIRDQIAPPAVNFDHPDPQCDLNSIPNHARPAKIDCALTNSFGFTEALTACLIFKRPEL